MVRKWVLFCILELGFTIWKIPLIVCLLKSVEIPHFNNFNRNSCKVKQIMFSATLYDQVASEKAPFWPSLSGINFLYKPKKKKRRNFQTRWFSSFTDQVTQITFLIIRNMSEAIQEMQTNWYYPWLLREKVIWENFDKIGIWKQSETLLRSSKSQALFESNPVA